MLERLLQKLFALRVLFLASLVCVPTSIGALAEEVSLTRLLPENSIVALKEILEIAMTDAESIQLRELAEQDFEGRNLASKAARNLNLRGNLTYRKEQDFEDTNSDIGDRLLYSLTLSKSLFHWGALKANSDKGDLSLEIEELRTFETYRNLALDVRKKYLNILVTNKEVELSRKNLERERAKLAVEEDRLKSGSASVVQVYNLELRVNAAELDLLKKEHSLEDQIDVLARLTGVSPEKVSAGLASGIPEQVRLSTEQIARLDEYFDEGLTNSSTLQSQSKSIEYTQKDLHISNQRLKPKISMSVGLTQYEIDEIGRRRAEEIVYGGVNISWNIFDGGAARGSKLSAISRVEQVKRQFESAKSSYRFGLERARKLLDLNTRILEREEKALAQAGKNLRDMNEDVKTGRASPDNLETVEIAFAKQEVRANESRSEYLNAVASIASLLGFDSFAQKFIDNRSE